MFGLHIGLICFLQIGITLANDYTYEVLSEPKESQESKYGEGSYPYEISSTELGKRQGYYRTEKQDGVAASIPLVIALGIGGIVAGLAVVQNANEARNNLQSQLDTINTRIGESRSSVTSLSTSLASLSSSVNSNLERTTAACAAAASASMVVTDLTMEALVTSAIQAIINTIGAFPCP